jgi:hypothetical protein
MVAMVFMTYLLGSTSANVSWTLQFLFPRPRAKGTRNAANDQAKNARLRDNCDRDGCRCSGSDQASARAEQRAGRHALCDRVSGV